jgi:serine protease inhibitor
VTDRAHLAFTLALHRVVAPDGRQNACWSPYSVASALGLVALGANGLTRDELLLLLLGDKSGDPRELGRLFSEAARIDDADAVLAVANRLWADERISIRESYVDELVRWPSGSVEHAPFRSDPDKARKLINREVAEITRRLIPELVPEGAIRRDTVAALVNALYLKCAWRNKFDENATRPRPFHAPGGTIEVPTMELTETVGYAATDGWQVVSLPAVGGTRAVVLLPDTDLTAAEPSLDAGSLARLLDAPRPVKVRLRLPKVDVRTQTELTPALNQLGVRAMFSDDADLSGISPDPLAVQAVLHESVLKVDEQGFEGAAATAVMFRLTSIDMTQPLAVDVDRPFLLLVQHTETGMIYFATRVVQP